MDSHQNKNVIDNQINYFKQLDILSNRLTSDHKMNIDIVVAFANEILGGVCSLYNKLDKRDNSLVCWSKDNTPPDLPEKDNAKGHICYEATIKGKDKIINLPDISITPYQQSDPYVQKYGLKSYLGFPVKINNQCLGSLCIVDTEIRQFSELEIALITHLANIIRIQEENLKISNIQTVLYKISRTLITSNNLPELCIQIKNNLSTIIDSSNFTITLFNQDEDEVYRFNEFKEDKNCVEKYLLEKVKHENKSLLFTHSQILEILPPEESEKCSCVSWIGVPLKINNEMIGVISLKSCQQQLFLEEDVNLLEFVSFEIAHILNEKRLRENISRKEEEYRSIVNQSAMGIYRTDFSGNILFVNDALVTMLEYDNDKELLNNDLTKTYHPDYERKYFIQSLIEKTIITNSESLWTTKTGKKIFVRETAKLVKHDDNYGIIEGTVEDITEEVNARKAYKFEKEKFDNLLTTVPIGIIQVDKNDAILSVNEHFTKITGYKKEDLINVSQFFHMVFDENNNTAQNIQQNSSLKILYDKTGQKKYIKIFKTKTTDGTSIFSIEDITATIIHKSELIEQSKYLSAINKISNKLLSGSIIPYDEILEIIGKTLNTSQITLYKYYKFDDRSEIQTMAQWGNSGEANDPVSQLKQQYYSPRETFPNWTKKLTNQEYMYGTIDTFISPEKEYMQSKKIKSIFVHNLIIEDKFWGFIVLKNYKEKRVWSDRDIMLIQTIINNLSDAISQKLMNSKLRNSKSSYMELFKNSSSGIIIFNQAGTIENINPTAEKMFERRYQDIIDKPIKNLINDNDIVENIENSIKFCNTVNSSKKMDIIIHSGDDIKALDLTFKKILYFDKSCIIMYAHDITLRYKKEYEIKKNLTEKQTLLQEIHHRVKNNLQIISSLLNLQMKDIETEKDKTLFLDSQNRIKSIALIHESLYNSKNLSKINFCEYTEKLINRLFTVYHIPTHKIRHELNIPKLELNIKKAIPCGLIMDELITNSLKYAFPGDKNGVIQISMKNINGFYCLSVKDNGIGFDTQKVLKDKTTLGIELITTLTQQLKGTYKFSNDNGFCVVIEFPE